MLDQHFCQELEYRIGAAMRDSGDEQVKGFWCDGVALSEPETYYTLKYINDNRRTCLRAYLGHDGQSEYRLLLQFGAQSLSRYARGLSVIDCIPSSDTDDWLAIDMQEQLIEVRLL